MFCPNLGRPSVSQAVSQSVGKPISQSVISKASRQARPLRPLPHHRLSLSLTLLP